MSGVRIAAISDRALDVAAHLGAVSDATMGAGTTFVGRVRDHDPDAAAAVVALEYSAHPDKTDLPVWKRQVEADGTTAWKGIGG